MRIFLFLYLLLGVYTEIYANFQVLEVFPNTLDDKNLEYIKIKNTSLQQQDINNYYIEDISGKQYMFGEEIFAAEEEKIFYRPQTKIILNNSNEILFLYNSGSILVNKVSYIRSTKGEVIFFGDEDESGKSEIDDEIDSGTGEVIGNFNIVFDLQRPSYVTQSGSSDVYVCDGEHAECKVNFDLRKNFTVDFPKRKYNCKIQFGSGFLTGEENKCNPNTVIFPEGVFEVYFRIFKKENNTLIQEKKIFIDNREDRKIIREEKKVKQRVPKIHISYPQIIVQSGLDGKGSFFYCQDFKCRVNLKYEKLDSSERCYWKFGNINMDNPRTYLRCNPGYLEFGPGYHKLVLRVYENNFGTNRKELKFFVENSIIEKVNEKIDINEKNNTGEEEVIIPEKIENIRIILQGKVSQDKTLSGSILECRGQESCYVNITSQIEGRNQELNYIWKRDGEEFSTKKNPKGIWIYGIGEHQISVEVLAGKDMIAEDIFLVNILKKISVLPSGVQKSNTSVGIIKTDGKEQKIDFTQNFLPLKYDGLRISGKAPVGSKIEVYIGEEKIGEGQTNKKERYRIVSKNLIPGSYIFNTRITLIGGRELLLIASGTKDIQAEDIKNWFLVKNKKVKKNTKKIKVKKVPQLIVKNYTEKVQEEFGEEPLILLQKMLFQIALLLLGTLFFLHIISQYFYSVTNTGNIALLIAHFSVRQKIHLIIT